MYSHSNLARLVKIHIMPIILPNKTPTKTQLNKLTQRHEVDLPAVLLELRGFSIPPNWTPVTQCERHARTLCETCPEWLSRTNREEEAAKLGHVVAQTKLGIEM